MRYLIRGVALAALGFLFVLSNSQRGWAPEEYHHELKPLGLPCELYTTECNAVAKVSISSRVRASVTHTSRSFSIVAS